MGSKEKKEESLGIEGELIYYAHTLSPLFKQLNFLPLTDVHYGNHLFSASCFDESVATIKDTPNMVTVLGGDLCESTLKTSKGDIYRQVGSPQDQRDWMIEKLYPIRHKILGSVIGNHEIRIYNECGIDICKDIATALGIPYRPSGMMLKVSFGDGNNNVVGRPYVYWVYFTHGYGGARTKSAKAVKLERTARLYGWQGESTSEDADQDKRLPQVGRLCGDGRLPPGGHGSTNSYPNGHWQKKGQGTGMRCQSYQWGKQ
jgi:hypothetical protein